MINAIPRSLPCEIIEENKMDKPMDKKMIPPNKNNTAAMVVFGGGPRTNNDVRARGS